MVDVQSADIMATLVALKYEVERKLALAHKLRFTFVGAMEAHLLARELGEAGVGVILTMPRPLPMFWDSRRM